MKPKKFTLPYKEFGEEYVASLESKAVIISFFGKSTYSSSSCKMEKIDNLLGYPIFKTSILDDPAVDPDTLCQIEGYHDSEKRVIYLHLLGTLDTHTLVKTLDTLSSDLDEKGYLCVWAELKERYARALLFLFTVSHLLVLCDPSHTFDISYVHLFRALDAIRLKMQGLVGEVLSKVPGVSTDWIYASRLCPPRVLFLFMSAPKAIMKHTTTKSNGGTGNVKKLEHGLEDQIYRILRKSRIVTNVSANSLFAIPANQEFVYVQTEEAPMKDWLGFMASSLIDFCQNPNLNSERNHCSFGYESLPKSNVSITGVSTDHSFKEFLQQHVDHAFLKGFDDNVGRHMSTTASQFEIPKLAVWFEAANQLLTAFLSPSQDTSTPSTAAGESAKHPVEALSDLLNTDVRFSKTRCNKVLPHATATYQENLPTHYAKKYHLSKMAHALSVFGVHARGPLVDQYVADLEKECERHWQNGRQMCEVLSLTGNPCTNPLHRGGSGQLSTHPIDQLPDLPVMEHSSGVRVVSACDCGRKQGSRDDPFTVRTANHDFYQLLGVECGCSHLERIQFPVFQPSTLDYRAAQLFSSLSGPASHKESSAVVQKELGTQQGNTQGLSLAYVSGQSVGGGSDLVLESGLHATSTPHQPHPSDNTSSLDTAHEIVLQVSKPDDAQTNKDKGLVRQPSTTEYLPGMLHSQCPGTLLPQFSSWSLVCLGPSSLYSHNLGLQEQQQAGLLGGSAYLLPWDVSVSSHVRSTPALVSTKATEMGKWSLPLGSGNNPYTKEGANDIQQIERSMPEYDPGASEILENQQKERYWPTVGDQLNSSHGKPSPCSISPRSRKSKGGKDSSEFSVKIFVGVEYECPRGHRFMCSGPDKVLKTLGGGLVKDNGNKVTGCDMPLYFPCPCRSSKPLIAQLMRVHVVTPKAPVHVTLNPRVQPAPSPCPVFITGNQEPLCLSQSAYWVLRLPYVYMGERGPYIAPKDHVPLNYGRLLAGMYSISEVAVDVK